MTKRKSVRKFDENAKLTQEELAKVKDVLNNAKRLCPELELDFEIVPCGQTNCKWNAEYCLLCYSQEGPLWLENVGYVLEQLDLALAQMGLGVCWYGWGKPEEQYKCGKRFAIMLCFGKCDSAEFRTETKQFNRKSAAEICKGEKGRDIAELARLAPSAVNSQPWAIKQNGEALEVWKQKRFLANFSKQLCDWFNRIDMGIFLVFWEAACEACGYGFVRALEGGEDRPTAVYTLL